jgi:hypothetical protein
MTTVLRWSFGVALAVLPTLGGPAQAPETQTGVISGTVVDAVSGAVVPGAVVTISARPTLPRTATTRQIADSRGRFAFTGLPAGAEFTIEAMKHGYLPGGFGREVSPADPLRQIKVPQGGWLPDVRVSLFKPGSIAGVVRDEAGEPVVGVIVRVLIRLRLHGRDDLAAGAMTMTDDLGAYRITGLTPASYIVQVPSVQSSLPAAVSYSARGLDPEAAIDVDETSRLVIGRYPLPPPPIDGRRRAYPMAFHPAALSVADAATIDLKYGDERQAVDITLTPVPAVRISGIVQGPAEALSSLTVRLLPLGLDRLGQGGEAATAFVGADGRFTLLNVPAGAYVLDAPPRITELTTGISSRAAFPVPPGRYGWQRQSQPLDGLPGLQFSSTDFRGGAGANFSGRMPLVVDAADIDNVVLPLRQSVTMRGQITFETLKGAPPPSLRIRLDPVDADPALDMPADGSLRNPLEGGEFVVEGIRAAKYWLRLDRTTTDWIVKSITWKGRDYTTQPFDGAAAEEFADVVVTVTNMVPELTGAVRGGGDVPRERAMVVAFPVDPSLWRNTGWLPAHMKTASVSADGTYRFTTLPAGDYYVVAIDRAMLATWRDPTVLADLQRSAARVALAWSRAASLDVTIATVRR